MKKPTTNVGPSRNNSDQQNAIDLDDIVEKWVWQMWNRTKTKSLSRYK